MVLILSGWFLIFRFKGSLDSFISFGYVASSVVIIFGLIYQFLLIDYFPSSSLVLMSFVRNSNLVFIFWMLTFLSFLNSISIKKTLPILLAFVVIVFSRFELISLIFLLLLSFIAIWFYKFFSFQAFAYLNGKNLNKSITALTLGLFCIFSLYNVYQADQKVKNSFSDYGYKYFGKWTSRIEEEDFFKSLIKIRNDQREYLFIDLTRDGSKKIASIHGKIDSFNSEGFDGLLPSADSNTLVQKGKFIGDFGHFYLRPNQYHEHKHQHHYKEVSLLQF